MPLGISAFNQPIGAPALLTANAALSLTPMLASPAATALPVPVALPTALAAAVAETSRPGARSKTPRPAKAAADIGRLSSGLASERRGQKDESGLNAMFDGSGVSAKDNATSEYDALMSGPPRMSLRASESQQIQELRKYKILFVPGFMSGAFIRLGNHTLWPGRRYFGDQLAWLERNGIEYEVADVHTLRSVEHGAPVVARAIESSEKPILTVTHSMGGSIMLHALITRPDLRDRVRGWAPVQAPFLGSHIADLASSRGAAGLLWLFGGSRETADAMTTARARKYYLRHRKAIAEVLRVVPVVAFASWVDTSAPRWLLLVNPLLKWTWDTIARRGGRNDILVPVKSAVLPGMTYIAVPGVDHLAPFVDTQTSFDRVRFLKTLLAMILRREPAP